MRIDDIIPIIFIIIFFVLPLIGRIVEALGGGSAKKPSSSSSGDTKEYLQKMRGYQQKPQPRDKYRAPVTKPGGGYDYGVERKQKKTKEIAVYDIEPSPKVAEQVALALEPKKAAVAETAKPAKSATQARHNILRTRVLEAPRFNDLQKAIVLKEIFSKPKAISLNLLRTRE